jgi:catechol 2,3-dioxygenase-like lactoylglutathione lyase family enzyme
MARLPYVTLLVHDYDTAIAFFVHALGFELVEDRPLDAVKRWVVVRPAGATSGLLLARAADDTQRTAVGRQAGGRVGFFLHTDDFAADHQRMTERGVRFLEAPREEPYGVVAVFEDCSGNRWDLLEPRAPSPPL